LGVLLAGSRYDHSWGRPGFQGRTRVPKLGRNKRIRGGGRGEQVEMLGSIQALWFKMLYVAVGPWGSPELTKSEGKVQAVCYHYMKGRV